MSRRAGCAGGWGPPAPGAAPGAAPSGAGAAPSRAGIPARPGWPTRVLLRGFQAVALAEGVALPSILLAAAVHALTGVGAPVVAAIGATHGTLFCLYLAAVPFLRRRLGWSRATTLMALGASLVPFAPWRFERAIRPQVQACLGGPLSAARPAGGRGAGAG